MKSNNILKLAIAGLLLSGGTQVHAAAATCPVANSTALKTALAAVANAAKAAGATDTKAAGLGNDVWAVVVDNNGKVCAVASSEGTAAGVANDVSKAWLASRSIAAQKAFAANGLSLSSGADGTSIALSTANLNQPAQPGGSLYGLEVSNPVQPEYNVESAAGGDSDPMMGQFVGGINVFGGGLALYSNAFAKVGGIGVSGDTSCKDHIWAWLLRHQLAFDNLPKAVVSGKTIHGVTSNSVTSGGDNRSGTKATSDNMNFAKTTGFSHPACSKTEKTYIDKTLVKDATPTLE